MSEILHEICQSTYNHQILPESKDYYINNEQKIVCAECLTPYLLAQSTLLAKVWSHKIFVYITEEIVPSEGDFKFVEYAPIVEYMRPLLDDSSLYTNILFNDKCTVTLVIKDDTYTGIFTPVSIHSTEEQIETDLKEFFMSILEYHFNMGYHEMPEEVFDEIQEAHQARYNSNAQQ